MGWYRLELKIEQKVYRDKLSAYSLADAAIKFWQLLPSEIRGKWEPEELISHINKVESKG